CFLFLFSEFIGEDGNEKFWQFVDTVKELTVYKHGESVRSYYNLILKKAGQFLTDLQVSLLKFALALRSYSPAVHASQQIASDEPPPEACPAFVSIHGQHSCSTKEIKKLLKAAAGRPKPYLYKNDHTYPGVNKTDVPVVILYAEIGTKKFTTFHKVLSEKAGEGTLVYVLRHYPQKMLLSGYGVELAIKSTEYKAVDDTKVKGQLTIVNAEDDNIDEVQGFLFGKLKKSHPEIQEQLTELRKHLLESTNDMVPLKVWEMQDLSFQAASRIMSVPKFDALKLMRDLSQNFPSKRFWHSTKSLSLFFQHLSETIGVHPGDGELFINGLHIDLDIHNPFSILDILRGEARVLEGLHNLGIKGEHQGKLLRLPVNAVDDSYALDIRHPAIMWLNDIENDPVYRSWPTGVQELLRATFPGVIRQIRRNFFNLVLFLDPVREESVELVKLAELFYKHKIPLRLVIGFVFVVNTKDEIDGFSDAGVGFYRLLNYIADEYDLSQALLSMLSMYNKVDVGETLSVDTVSSYLKRKFPKANAERILGVESEYDDKRQDGALFHQKSGLGALPLALFNGVPLSPDEMDPDELETIILQRIMDTTTAFQRAVFMGQLTEGSDVVDYLMEEANVVPRMNPLILSTDRQYLDFTAKPGDLFVDDWEDTTMFSFLDSRDKTAVMAKRMKYFTNSGMESLIILYEDGMSAVTMWIVGDFEKVSGRKLLLSALKHMQKASPGVRVGVIDNPSGKPSEDNTVLYRAIWASLLTQKNKAAAEFVQKLLKEESSQLLQQGTKMKDLLIQGMDDDAFEKKFNTLEVDFIRSQQQFCQDVLKLRPGQRAVISNGRILGPFEEQEEFTVEDFHLLEKITLTFNTFLNMASDLVMKVDALLTAAPKGEVRRDVHFIKDSHSVLRLSPRENEVFYDVVAIVDPLTREAQKMSSVLIVLSQVVNVRLQVFMNCRAKLSEMPLKSFYRFVLESDVYFLANDTVSPGPVARFMELPESPLLTLNMITPESWIVQAVRSPHDLDNIHLAMVLSINHSPVVVFCPLQFLEHLLLEGHCFDLSTGQPPRGLQFTLGMSRDPLMYDTIVMANLGYFQLKANPGAWILRLRKGRSEDIYQILTHDGTDSPADAGDVIVVLNSFHSKIIKVRVQKKAEKINEDLLSENSESKGIWDSIASITGGSKKDDGEKKKEDVLNIFSVASGHLYERFLRIMMLSVLRHTETPVKFWFLKNYLSPSFKETISHMAETYGFQYELVQYKWPRWLHQQTEKQRIIWGYKILFLDVLFPLAVDKIIFVDADQIVRADLKELRDLDLEGAPYGYTPFCDSRREMEGYRFWKTGYWASHLGHRKYHISALYVVDLKKFRKIAAGDRLRGQYQALSQDPNSLSNLDQDLPNNMIHQVAIKSLPQEWLWCETWCDDTSKVTAKTIDLCNNPKTKEPKLTAAARIVPEWVEYDNEIKQLLRRVQEQEDTAAQKQTPSSSQHKNDNRRDEL
uniref:UDP-glucose ceramide glucosyltransferase-like 1 n=1 Tax=Dicentrarchus labrax TaxID=13489 RepID=A0A8C4II02_DICLA